MVNSNRHINFFSKLLRFESLEVSQPRNSGSLALACQKMGDNTLCLLKEDRSSCGSTSELVSNTGKNHHLLAEELVMVVSDSEIKAEKETLGQRTALKIWESCICCLCHWSWQVWRHQTSSSGHPYHMHKHGLSGALKPCHQLQWSAKLSIDF